MATTKTEVAKIGHAFFIVTTEGRHVSGPYRSARDARADHYKVASCPLCRETKVLAAVGAGRACTECAPLLAEDADEANRAEEDAERGK